MPTSEYCPWTTNAVFNSDLANQDGDEQIPSGFKLIDKKFVDIDLDLRVLH